MEKMNELEEVLKKDYANTGAIVVTKQGKKVYEYYQQGCDEQSPFHVFSVTKSIMSLLIGKAIEQGYITDVHTPVLDFFPDYQVKRREHTIQKITLYDLLTMTAPYKYRFAPYTKFFTSEDWVKSSLDLLGGKGKIGDFRYAPVIGPDIFSGIIRNTTGMRVLEFANRNLFAPLSIQIPGDIYFEDKEGQMEFYHSKTARGWVVDPQGTHTAGWGLVLTIDDMTKIGELMLHEGAYQGKQIISSEWIKQCTEKKSEWKTLQFHHKYGYLWWVIEEEEHSFAALGDGGNVIYVNPKKELTVSIGSYFKPRAADRMKLIKEKIEPLF